MRSKPPMHDVYVVVLCSLLHPSNECLIFIDSKFIMRWPDSHQPIPAFLGWWYKIKFDPALVTFILLRGSLFLFLLLLLLLLRLLLLSFLLLFWLNFCFLLFLFPFLNPFTHVSGNWLLSRIKFINILWDQILASKKIVL